MSQLTVFESCVLHEGMSERLNREVTYADLPKKNTGLASERERENFNHHNDPFEYEENTYDGGDPTLEYLLSEYEGKNGVVSFYSDIRDDAFMGTYEEYQQNRYLYELDRDMPTEYLETPRMTIHDVLNAMFEYIQADGWLRTIGIQLFRRFVEKEGIFTPAKRVRDMSPSERKLYMLKLDVNRSEEARELEAILQS